MSITMQPFPIPLYWFHGRVECPLNLNNYRNWHYYRSNNIKKQIRDYVMLQRHKIPVFTGPVWFDYYLYPRQRGSDMYNWLAVVEKFTTDALVKAGRIEKDNMMIVIAGAQRFVECDKENPRFEIIIRNVTYKEK